MRAKANDSGLRLVGGKKRPPKAKPETAPEPPNLADLTAGFAARSRSANTRKAYASDWKFFTAWCEGRDVPALPATPETVAMYLAAHAHTLKPATLSRRLLSISQMHQAAGEEPPTRAVLVRKTYAGICRDVGTAQAQKTPLLASDVRAIMDALPDTLGAKRDRALILLGFAGAFRISELVGLNVSDLVAVADGLIVTIRKSKTDQEGRGQRVGIPFGANEATCPVRAYRAWITAANIKSGPVLRPVDKYGNVSAGRLSSNGGVIAIKRAASLAGYDPVLYSGHSLRAGLATSAAQQGKSERKIMAQTRHKSEKQVRSYIRDADLFKDNAAAGLV